MYHIIYKFAYFEKYYIKRSWVSKGKGGGRVL